jgi:hypothetical protein
MAQEMSFELLHNEEIIADSSKDEHSLVKPVYSVVLTNQRVFFRLETLGSSLTKSFFYSEILDAKTTKRLFFNYLMLVTKSGEHYFNTSEPGYWSEKILRLKEKIKGSHQGEKESTTSLSGKNKVELLDMLSALRKNSILTEEEFKEKVRLLDSLPHNSK